MGKLLPVWVLLLCLLLGAVFTMLFGWAVKSTLEGSGRSGTFGRAAVAVASFPALVGTVFTEVRTDVVSPEDLSRVPRPGVDLSGYTRLSSRTGVDVRGLRVRVDPARRKDLTGWHILVGAFSIDGELRDAALAISPALEIEKIWLLEEAPIEGAESPRPRHRKLVHGFAVLKDGSVIFSYDGGVSLQRADACGERLWAIPGQYHHLVSLEDGGMHAWVTQGLKSRSTLVRVATDDGEVVRRITLAQIIYANPEIDILEIRRHTETGYADNTRDDPGEWLPDPIHMNDVEPLPASLADAFEDFAAGDLLVSARSLNLVFVLDPETLKVKWWSIGATRRQHDPDWDKRGLITVYDNRMSRHFSRIIALDPKTSRVSVLLDGQEYDFYSRIRGTHQVTPAGNLLLTSPQQGRVMEFTPDGDLLMEIFNTDVSDDAFNYVVSQAIWLPEGYLEMDRLTACSG